MAKLNASHLMGKIIEYAPVTLLFLAFLSFVAIGIFSVDYYHSLFSRRFGPFSIAMAILVAIIQEAIRFGLLVASMKDFSDDKKFNGWLGLIGSICLVVHDVKVSWEIALMWTSSQPEPYYNIFLFLIGIGLLLELRLVLTMADGKKSKNTVLSRYRGAQTRNGVNTVANN